MHHTFVVVNDIPLRFECPFNTVITLLPSLRTSECLNTCTYVCLNCQFTDYSLGRSLYCEYAAFSTNNTSLWSGSASLLQSLGPTIVIMFCHFVSVTYTVTKCCIHCTPPPALLLFSYILLSFLLLDFLLSFFHFSFFLQSFLRIYCFFFSSVFLLPTFFLFPLSNCFFLLLFSSFYIPSYIFLLPSSSSHLNPSLPPSFILTTSSSFHLPPSFFRLPFSFFLLPPSFVLIPFSSSRLPAFFFLLPSNVLIPLYLFLLSFSFLSFYFLLPSSLLFSFFPLSILLSSFLLFHYPLPVAVSFFPPHFTFLLEFYF